MLTESEVEKGSADATKAGEETAVPSRVVLIRLHKEFDACSYLDSMFDGLWQSWGVP